MDLEWLNMEEQIRVMGIFYFFFFLVLTRSRLKWDCLPFIHVTIASGHWSLTVIEQSVPGSALVRVRLKPGAHSHLNVYHT